MSDSGAPASPPSAPSPPPSSKFLAALRTISPVSDLPALASYPCARDSLLFGITLGVSVGVVRFLFASRGRPLPAGALRGATTATAGARASGSVLESSNWAVGGFGVGSLGAWYVVLLLLCDCSTVLTH